MTSKRKLRNCYKLELQIDFDNIMRQLPEDLRELCHLLKIMSQLPEELQELCHLLQMMSQRQIAAKTKKSRHQLNKKLELLRKAFKETLG